MRVLCCRREQQLFCITCCGERDQDGSVCRIVALHDAMQDTDAIHHGSCPCTESEIAKHQLGGSFPLDHAQHEAFLQHRASYPSRLILIPHHHRYRRNFMAAALDNHSNRQDGWESNGTNISNTDPAIKLYLSSDFVM
jgi:hypothetical protein